MAYVIKANGTRIEIPEQTPNIEGMLPGQSKAIGNLKKFWTQAYGLGDKLYTDDGTLLFENKKGNKYNLFNDVIKAVMVVGSVYVASIMGPGMLAGGAPTAGSIPFNAPMVSQTPGVVGAGATAGAVTGGGSLATAGFPGGFATGPGVAAPVIGGVGTSALETGGATILSKLGMSGKPMDYLSVISSLIGAFGQKGGQPIVDPLSYQKQTAAGVMNVQAQEQSDFRRSVTQGADRVLENDLKYGFTRGPGGQIQAGRSEDAYAAFEDRIPKAGEGMVYTGVDKHGNLKSFTDRDEFLKYVGKGGA